MIGRIYEPGACAVSRKGKASLLRLIQFQIYKGWNEILLLAAGIAAVDSAFQPYSFEPQP
jgi:hypothetical protein